ncbi:S1C family serine protease [Oceanibacterium hippocampi]|uniref:Serine endoprotease DegS n=1 Tax=Oceanibacterium hippocampi TaxID=745714 RepID=A0A1Y5S1I5_9PROT|nr:S1C family serine protease [Oceanibacterium hippocampi]SLN27541.1 Serine endoprotease DegS [Oceanibacterium hippocampi]
MGTYRSFPLNLLAAALAGLAFLVAPGAESPARAQETVTDSAQTSAAQVFGAVVRVTAEVPAEARTASSLGRLRSGNGVIIDDSGLVLTIGYLILEADTVLISEAGGRHLPAEIVAYDYDTGFGLVRALGALRNKPLRLGSSADLVEDSRVAVIGAGGPGNSHGGTVVSRREFAGYWEYLLDSAIYTSPPHADWGGAALVDPQGRLVGIGSLIVGDARPGPPPEPGNMFVPIDLLKPILGDLLAGGRVEAPPHPWFGMFTRDTDDGVVVSAVTPDGPAAGAGIRPGDKVVAVGGMPVGAMAELFRTAWAMGPPGTVIELGLERDGAPLSLPVTTGDRYDWLRFGRGN